MPTNKGDAPHKSHNTEQLDRLLNAHHAEKSVASSHAWFFAVAGVTGLYFLYLYLIRAFSSESKPSDQENYAYSATEPLVLTLLLPVVNEYLCKGIFSPEKLLKRRYPELKEVSEEDLRLLFRLRKGSQLAQFSEIQAPDISKIRGSVLSAFPMLGMLPIGFWALLLYSFYDRSSAVSRQAEVANIFYQMPGSPDRIDIPDYAFDLFSSYSGGMYQLDNIQDRLIPKIFSDIVSTCERWLKPHGMYPPTQELNIRADANYSQLIVKSLKMTAREISLASGSGFDLEPASGVRFNQDDALVFLFMDKVYKPMVSETVQRFHEKLSEAYQDQFRGLLSKSYADLERQLAFCFGVAPNKFSYDQGFTVTKAKQISAWYHNEIRNPIGRYLGEASFNNRFGGNVVLTIETMLFFRPILTALARYIDRKYQQHIKQSLLRQYCKIKSINQSDGSFQVELKRNIDPNSLQNWLSLYATEPQVYEVDGCVYAAVSGLSLSRYQRFQQARRSNGLPIILGEENYKKLIKPYHDLLTALGRLSSLGGIAAKGYVGIEQLFDEDTTTLYLNFDSLGGIDFAKDESKRFIAHIKHAMNSVSNFCSVVTEAGIVSLQIDFTAKTHDRVIHGCIRHLNKQLVEANTACAQLARRVRTGIFFYQGHRKKTAAVRRRTRTGGHKVGSCPQPTPAMLATPRVVASRHCVIQPGERLAYTNAQKEAVHYINTSNQACSVFAARSKYDFDRLYVIPEIDLDTAFAYMYPNAQREVADLVVEQLQHWTEPLTSKNNRRFNFVQWRSNAELPAHPGGNRNAVKFRSHASGDRTHFEEQQSHTGIFYYTGVANHQGRYLNRPRILGVQQAAVIRP